MTMREMLANVGSDDRDREPLGLSARSLRPRRLLAALGIWIGLVVVAILNVVVRENLIAPAVGDYWGHVIGSGTFIGALAIIAVLYFTRGPAHTMAELWAIGTLWLGLTVVFEFGFGHYVMGHSWERLLADYNLLAGRVWILVLVATFLFPVLFGQYLRR